MKNISIIFILSLSLGFFSCSDDSEEQTITASKITSSNTLENAFFYDGKEIPITKAILIKHNIFFDEYRNYDLMLSGILDGDTHVFSIELFSLVTGKDNPVFTPGTFKYIKLKDDLSNVPPVPAMSFSETANIYVEGAGTQNLITAETGKVTIEESEGNYTFTAALSIANDSIKVHYTKGFEIMD